LNSTKLSGSLTGSFFNNTMSTTLNKAVLAPMPKASVNTAITVKLGFFQSICKPYRKSCQKVFIFPSSASLHSYLSATSGSTFVERLAGR
jgi:hypothetical protein